MAPQEVAGLQALAKAHGGSLTTNPDTGLPEAGFLSSILPMVIGAGLSVASGGALTPLMAAGITGAGYGVATGSLSKGLMAGMGAFGGAGLAGGLMSAGAAGVGAAEAGAAGVGSMGPQTAAQLGTGFEASMAAQGITPTVGATGASMGAQTAGQLGAGFQADMAAQGIQPSAFSAPPVSPINAAAAVPTTTPAPTPMADKFSQLGQGFKNLGTEAGREAFMGNAASKGVEATGVGGGMGLLKYGYAAGLPLLMQEPEKAAQKPSEKPWMYSYDPGRVADPQAGYTGAATGQRNYFNPIYTRTAAGGGLMDTGPVEAMSDRNQAETVMANGGMRYAQGGIASLAQGGQSHLGDYSDGGRLLRGPGDGVSDDIPATIGEKRPARLADGEFVVPARIVSELGNGSTEAGARKLYAMMDRVQKARSKTVGKDRVAVNSRAEKLLPV